MTFAELHEHIAAGCYADAAQIYQDLDTDRYFIGARPGCYLVGTVGRIGRGGGCRLLLRREGRLN